jgi:hypothetical protein
MKFSHLFLLLFFISISCQSPPSSQKATEKVEKASKTLKKITQRSSEWEQLFYKEEGWFGGDGIFAVPMNGKEYVQATDKDTTLFLFSDSLIKLKGKIKNGHIKKGAYKMVHNSIGIMVGEGPQAGIDFHWKKDENGKAHSLFEPAEKYLKTEDYFWLGDGFVNTAHDSTLYIFAYRVRDVWGDAFFPFEQMDVSIIKIKKGEKFPFDNKEIIETDLMFPLPDKFGKTTFGNSVLVNTKEAGAPHPDGYIYIYGTVGYLKDLLVARVLPKDFENRAAWRFWDGEGWNADKTKVVGVTKNTANELSISPLPNGQFLLVSQKNGMEPYVHMQLAKSPVGAFYPQKTIWYCEEVDEDKDFFAYNAKAHPSISPEGKLVITYNVNSFDFFVDVLTKGHHYRPRFITLDLD